MRKHVHKFVSGPKEEEEEEEEEEDGNISFLSAPTRQRAAWSVDASPEAAAAAAVAVAAAAVSGSRSRWCYDRDSHYQQPFLPLIHLQRTPYPPSSSSSSSSSSSRQRGRGRVKRQIIFRPPRVSTPSHRRQSSSASSTSSSTSSFSSTSRSTSFLSSTAGHVRKPRHPTIIPSSLPPSLLRFLLLFLLQDIFGLCANTAPVLEPPRAG